MYMSPVEEIKFSQFSEVICVHTVTRAHTALSVEPDIIMVIIEVCLALKSLDYSELCVEAAASSFIHLVINFVCTFKVST